MDIVEGRGRLGIRCYPIADERFVADVQAAVDGWPDGRPNAASLERRLLALYPSIRVVAQQPLAALGNGPVFYIYRDGHP